ncbi:MAG TPA: hypothetical protein VLH12_14870 [Usitatibacter sp.]|nr:hypothetical protein [Usitatibacter sp.]
MVSGPLASGVGAGGGVGVESAGGFAAGGAGAMSLAALGVVTGESTAGASTCRGFAAGAGIDGFDLMLFAALFDEPFVAMSCCSCAGAAAVVVFSATTTFSGGGDDSALVGVVDATAAGLSLMAWSKATAPTSTPTTIVPKAIPK